MAYMFITVGLQGLHFITLKIWLCVDDCYFSSAFCFFCQNQKNVIITIHLYFLSLSAGDQTNLYWHFSQQNYSKALSLMDNQLTIFLR